MITGQVSAERLAVVRASVKASGNKAGSNEIIDFIIDTYFDGYLSLPPALIEQMGLPFLNYHWFTLADDSPYRFPVHAAIIVWDGEKRGTLALASDGSPTIGTSLLHGFHFAADWIDGGEVTLSARQ